MEQVLTEADKEQLKATKALASKVKRELGELLKPSHKRALKGKARRKREAVKPSYEGLAGDWLYYYQIASQYEGKIPLVDRDDFRHDVMIELDRATKRDGKPLPPLRAYRIASLMVALYWRNQNRLTTRVCILNGYPVAEHCKGCPNSTGKPCAWLAVRPVASLDSEVIDSEGYRVRLVDTVASDSIADMPDRWYEVKDLLKALPLRLVEIAYKRLEHKPLTAKDRQYLSRYYRKQTKTLF